MTTDEMLMVQDIHDELMGQIRLLRSALQQCEDYLDGRSDVVDGSYGEPAPNAEMSLLTEVREALAQTAGERS